jgi:uncharacterized membrane protein
MTLKQYTVARMVIAALLAAFIASSVVRHDFFWPVVAMAAAILLLLFLRSRVREVLADERDYTLGGTAARWTIQIFSIAAVLGMFGFSALQERDAAYAVIASVLAYSTCALMLLYSVIFTVLRRRTSSHA